MDINANKDAVREIGRQLMSGAISEISNLVILILVITFVIFLVRGFFRLGIDDTDRDGWNRSGLKPLTDAKTGIQYLSDGKGGLHVRVGADGMPLK